MNFVFFLVFVFLHFSSVSVGMWKQGVTCKHYSSNGIWRRECTDRSRSLKPILNPFFPFQPNDDNDYVVDDVEEDDEVEDNKNETCGLRKGFRNIGGRIVGGRKAAKYEFPWMVSIQDYNEGEYFHRGGASILNKRWIISAAHVFHSNLNASYYRGVLDSLLANKPSVVVQFDQLIMHPDYNLKEKNYRNDIALLHTTEDIPLDLFSLNSICLPEERMPRKGLVTASGYGNIDSEGTQTDRMMAVELYMLKDDDCRRKFKSAFQRRIMLCAGYLRGGKDTCQGDSGGPLMMFKGKRSYLIGIVSYGYNTYCGAKDYGAVYTRVSKYLGWINKYI